MKDALRVDFASDALTYRRQHGGGKSQMIAKAVGIKPGITPSIVDCTAGLGKDSFILASLGCAVMMIERSPEIAALLEDGVMRARQCTDIAVIMERLSFYHGDSKTWLEQTDTSPEVIYLDPMFPERTKSALVKKEMRLFKEIVGTDDDADELLRIAREKALYRVVVKRPRLSPALGGSPADFSLTGQSSRFDIYVKRKLEKRASKTLPTRI